MTRSIPNESGYRCRRENWVHVALARQRPGPTGDSFPGGRALAGAGHAGLQPHPLERSHAATPAIGACDHSFGTYADRQYTGQDAVQLSRRFGVAARNIAEKVA